MAEIKYNDAFLAEVSAFKAAGEALGKAYIGASYDLDGLSLKTAEAYKNRLHEVFRLIAIYNAVIQRDAKDMEMLAARLVKADQSGG